MLTEAQRRKPLVKPIIRDGVLIGWRTYVRGAFGAFGASFSTYIWSRVNQ